MLSRRRRPSTLWAPPQRGDSSRVVSAIFHSNAEQITFSVGMVIDHPQNDGRFSYRKRKIGEKRFCHAVRHKCRTLQNVQLLNRHCVLTNALLRGVEHACSNVDPYKSPETFTVGRGLAPAETLLLLLSFTCTVWLICGK